MSNRLTIPLDRQYITLLAFPVTIPATSRHITDHSVPEKLAISSVVPNVFLLRPICRLSVKGKDLNRQIEQEVRNNEHRQVDRQPCEGTPVPCHP